MARVSRRQPCGIPLCRVLLRCVPLVCENDIRRAHREVRRLQDASLVVDHKAVITCAHFQNRDSTTQRYMANFMHKQAIPNAVDVRYDFGFAASISASSSRERFDVLLPMSS